MSGARLDGTVAAMSTEHHPGGPGETSGSPGETRELHVSDGGIWAIGSESTTVYVLDLDRLLLLRRRGQGSPVGAFDNEWVPLVATTSSLGEQDVVRVGERHRFLTDPFGGAGDYRWWIARATTSITAVGNHDTTAGWSQQDERP